jgi:GNAT superfamily N-acetyltransferase
MALRLELAGEADAGEIAVLRTAVADALTARFGAGHWSSASSDKGVLFGMRRGQVYVAREAARIFATLTLTKRKPWAIDRSYFTRVKSPLYLIAMAVAPDRQRAGHGRAAMAEAERLAREAKAHSIRLDAYDADAGAGEFYLKCGYTEMGRATYRESKLRYFELML